MWLITTFVAAVAATGAHFGFKDLRKYKLNFLALMLWGTFVMVLVDHAIGFLEGGGDFIEATTDGMVADSALLGVLMVVPLVAVWGAVASTRLGERIWPAA